MNIHLIRTAPCEADCATLREDLLLWAEVNDFTLTEESEERWEFQRGNPWRPLYSFHTRDLPTRVVVQILPRSGKALCALHCTSWLAIQTPGDEAKFRPILDSVIAFICEAGSRRHNHAEEDAPTSSPRWAPAADAMVAK